MTPPTHASVLEGKRTWTLLFAGYPGSDNDRRSWHWTTRRDRDREWHARVYLQVIDQQVKRPCTRIRLSAEFGRQRLGTADPDNDRARLKPIIDGLVHAGVIPNDTYAHVDLSGPCTEVRSAYRCLRLTIEDLSAEAA